MDEYGKGPVKPRSVTPPLNVQVHTTTGKERTDGNTQINKLVPGEGTRQMKRNRRNLIIGGKERVPWEDKGIQWKKRNQLPKAMQDKSKP